MITDDLIRKEFIHSTMKAGINKIYSTQRDVIGRNLNKVSGDLSSWSEKRRFDLDESDFKTSYYISVLPYLRFLDINYRKDKDRISMSIRRDLALYNRVVWGVLYGETFPALRYGMGKDVQNYIREQLQQGLQLDHDMINALDDF